LAASDDWVRPGDIYTYSEIRGFRSKAQIDAEEARIEELEEEGYSPSQAEGVVDGAPLEGGGGDEGVGAAP
jgi:hypothetical protein